ncbi:hypothetical protein M977_04113 [Buttiauxella gaviniae ATCC 51604]|uniref:Uncharacterized protein n=1 Tax=Buttiauxella gaviniae ATCC 51604 TaxID=1354253 RepID=A0A1B7HQB6_9ENTR|nr:hypothetical protein [Buttiauxella gaviniae]OAT17836.1 hypothetical protein M977_04113 [Buttiauxella gaviniae ATCC 51604]
MFSQIFTLNKISHDVAETIADENVFSYLVFNNDKTVTVKFPGGIIHDTYPCHHCALEEVTRIWFLIREAEIKAQRCTTLIFNLRKWKP